MDKFNRVYSLAIEVEANEKGSALLPLTDATAVFIELPFTIEFDINRNVLSSANTATIKVYNLSERTRGQIFKDQFDYNMIKRVELKAGYGTSLNIAVPLTGLSTVFKGTIVRAFSYRQGPNFITQIEADDGGFAIANGSVDTAFPAGTPVKAIIEKLIIPDFLPATQRGTVGNYDAVTKRGSVASGNTAAIIKELTGGGFFIDNGKIYCLKDKEALKGDIEIVDFSTGLIGTPMREETYIKFDIIFEPKIVMAQQLFVNSLTAPQYTGIGKVVSLKHRATISEAVAGDAVTSIGMFYGLNLQVVGTA